MTRRATAARRVCSAGGDVDWSKSGPGRSRYRAAIVECDDDGSDMVLLPGSMQVVRLSLTGRRYIVCDDTVLLPGGRLQVCAFITGRACGATVRRSRE